MNQGQIKLLANMIIEKIVLDELKSLGSAEYHYEPLDFYAANGHMSSEDLIATTDAISENVLRLRGNHLQFNTLEEMVAYVKNE